MGLQKYRFDISKPQADGAVVQYANWMGGQPVAGVSNCRIEGTDIHRTVYVTDEPDTWFSIPAACMVKGKIVRGYLASEDNLFYFRPYDTFKDLLGIA